MSTILDALWGQWTPVLLDAAVKGGMILTLAAAATLLMRRASAALRHAVWFLAIAGLLFLPVLSVTLPGWQVLPAWCNLAGGIEVLAGQESPPGRPLVPQDDMGSAAAAVPPGAAAVLGPPDRLASGAGQRGPGEGPVPADAQEAALLMPLPTLPAEPAAVDGARPAWSVRWILPWLSGLWAAGTALLLLLLILAQMSLWQLRRGSRRLNSLPWTAKLRAASARLRVNRSVVLLQSDRRPMPMVWGVLRPKLLLPSHSDGWPEERCRAVLLHELGHIQRWDCLSKLLAQVACALYWLNPLVWIASRLMQREAERACDDLVIHSGAAPRDYATQILEIASGARTPLLAAHGAIAMARKSHLEGRLLAILDRKRNRRPVTFLGALVAAVAIAGVAAVVASVRAAGPAESRADAAAREEPTEVAASPLGDAADQVTRSASNPVEVEPAEAEERTSGNAAEPALRLAIRCADEVLKAGDPIPITFAITNTGNRPYRYQDRTGDGSGRMPEYALLARDAQGTQVPDPLASSGGGPGGGLSSTATLPPGQSFTKTIALNLWALITRPGTYQVVGIYDPGSAPGGNRKTTPVRSAPISVTLQPRSDGEMAAYVAQLSKRLLSDLEAKDADELVRRLMYTCDRRIVPALIEAMYHDPATGDWWAREAFRHYLPDDRQATDALLTAGMKQGMAESMFDLLRERGCTPDQIKPLVEVSLSPEHRRTWHEGAKAAMALGDDRFTPRLIAIATDAAISPENTTREQAIRALPCHRTDEAVAALKKLLEDPDPAVRRVTGDAIRMAYLCRDQGVRFSRPLRDDDFDVKYRRPPRGPEGPSAGGSSEGVRQREGKPVAGAAGPTDPVSEQVARILAKADETAALRRERSRQYLAALSDEQLAKLYAPMPVQTGIPLDAALRAVRQRRGAIIEEMIKSRGPLSEQDETDFRLRRAKHVEELAALGPAAVPALAPWMGEAYKTAAKSDLIEEALVKMGPAAVEPVVLLMDSQDGHLRANAAGVLSRLADPRAKDVLLRALDDTDPSVRRYALWGLLALGPQTVGSTKLVGLLIDGLQDQPRLFDSIGGLARYGDETALEALGVVERFHLGRGKGDFRFAARRAMNEILQRAGKPVEEVTREKYDSEGTPSDEQIRAAARCPNAEIRRQAVVWLSRERIDQSALLLIERLGEEQDPRVLGEIEYHLALVMCTPNGRTKSAVSTPVVQKAFDALLSAAETRPSRARARAIAALGTILHAASGSKVPLEGVERFKGVVRKGLSSADTGIQSACYSAVTAIAVLAPETAARWSGEEKRQLQDQLRPLLDSSSPPIRLIECLGYVGDSQLTPRLIELLSHKDATIRGFAASALGHIGDPKAIPALKRVAETDPARHENGVYGVREAAKEAIRAIDEGVSSGRHEQPKGGVPDRPSAAMPFGPAVEGVQCRIEPEKTTWNTGETPTCRAFVRHQGAIEVWLSSVQMPQSGLEVDGVWYQHPQGEIAGSAYQRSSFWEKSPGVFRFSLDKEWVAIEGGRPLALSPGRHAVRYAWAGFHAFYRPGISPTLYDEERPVRLVSNPVEIEITAAEPAKLTEPGLGASDAAKVPPGTKTAAELLRALKTAENDGTQAEVARKLIALGDKSIVPDVVEMLKSEDRRARCNVGRVLAALGDERGLAAVLAELNDTGQRPTKMIRSDGKPNVPGQIRSDRYYAAHVLGEIGDRRAVPALIETLKDTSIGYQAAIVLGKLGDQRAVVPLKEILKSNDPNERLWAGYALGKLKDLAGVPAVAAFLKDPQWTQRRHAADSLWELADKRAVAPLIEALKDAQSEVRVSAARALGRIGDGSAIAALEALLKDDAVTTSGPPTAVRDAAAEAIRRIRAERPPTPDANSAAWGPVVERALTMDLRKATSYLDLDSGKYVDPPLEGVRILRDQLRRKGIDLYTSGAESMHSSRTAADMVVGELSEAAWDDSGKWTPQEARVNLARNLEGRQPSAGRVITAPCTIAFRTREGGIGLLRLVEPTETRPEVIARFKLLREPGHLTTDPPWGEPVEGVQIRVRAEKSAWTQGTVPSLRVDFRNQGTRDLRLVLAPEWWELECDGIWYRVTVTNTGRVNVLPLGPNHREDDIPVPLEERWGWRSRGREVLVFNPGKHVIRVALQVHPAPRGDGTPVRVVSNPVQIEIVADKPAPDAEPAGQPGPSVRGRVLDHEGKPVSGAAVVVGGISPRRFGGSAPSPNVQTDQEGRFTITDIDKRATHVLVSAPSLDVWRAPLPRPGQEVEIRLPEPATLKIRYDIEGAESEATLRLELKGRDMEGWKGLVEHVRNPTVSNQGEIVLSSLTPGLYDLGREKTLRGHGLGIGVLCDRNLNLTLAPGETAVVEFVRPTGWPVAGSLTGLPEDRLNGAFVYVKDSAATGQPRRLMDEWKLTTFDAVTTDAGGRFITGRLSPATYLVVAESYAELDRPGSSGMQLPDFVGTARVTVPADGKPPEVRIEMKPRAEFEKAAQAAEKAPVSAAGTGQALDGKEILRQLKSVDAADEAAFAASGTRPGRLKTQYKLTMLKGEMVYEEQILEIAGPAQDKAKPPAAPEAAKPSDSARAINRLGLRPAEHRIGEFEVFRRSFYIGPNAQIEHDWVGRIQSYGPLKPWTDNSPGPATAGNLSITHPNAATYMLLLRRPLWCLGRGYSRHVTEVKSVSKAEGGLVKVTGEGLDIGLRPGAKWELTIDPDAGYMVRSARVLDARKLTISIANSGLKRYGDRWAPEKAQFKGAFSDASFQFETVSPEADVALLNRVKTAVRPPYAIHTDIRDERVKPTLYLQYDAGKTSPRGRRPDWDIVL